MSKLNPQSRAILAEAIVDLVSPDNFRKLLSTPLNQQFDQLITTISYAEQVKEVVDIANERGWIIRLFDVLLTLHGEDQRLLGLASEMNRLQEGFFENYVKGGDMLGAKVFMQRINTIIRVVCSIIVEGAKNETGTATLVGPDLLLTNHHVLSQLIERPSEVNKVKIKFDYWDDENQTLLEYKGVDLEVIAKSPPDTPVQEDRPLEEEWTLDYLDYTLLRLPEEIGKQAHGVLRSKYNGKAPIRGWLPLVAPKELLNNDSTKVVRIVQHPQGENMKTSTGNLKGVDKHHIRLRYQTNTDIGSSGSPVFNEAVELIGIHHRGNRDYMTNQGIPITAIIKDLKRKGVRIPALPPPGEFVNMGWSGHIDTNIKEIIEVLYQKPFIGRTGLKDYLSLLEQGKEVPSVLLLNGRSQIGRSYIFHFCDRLVSRELFKLAKVDFRRQTKITPWELAQEIAILVDLPGHHKSGPENRTEDFKQHVFLNVLQSHLVKSKKETQYLFFLDHCHEQDLSIAVRDLIIGLANMIARDSVPGFLMVIGLSAQDQNRVESGISPTLENFTQQDLKSYFQLLYDKVRSEHPSLEQDQKEAFIELALQKIPETLFQEDISNNVMEISQRAELIGQALRESAKSEDDSNRAGNDPVIIQDVW